MKNNRLILLILLVSLFLLGGCAKSDNKEKSGNKNAEKTSSEESQFKKLYNPPAGGNPENIGKIVYASDIGETTIADYELYTINPDGSGKTKLTNHGKFINHPVWSPEHSRIAYAANVDQRDKIFIMTADGSERRQLTFGDSRDKFPTWSPDGKYLAYISYRNDIPNLFVVDVYGKNNKQLTFVEGKNTVLWPSWSPVSDVIAFSYNKEGDDIDFRIHTINSDGTDEKEILSSNDKDLSDHEPAWSPDGKMIYFLSNRTSQMEIWKFNHEQLVSTDLTKFPEFVGPIQVSSLSKAGINPDHRPRVSPDGKKIVFYGVGHDWNYIGTNLYTINIDGTGLTNITKSIDGSEWPDW